MPPIKKTPFQKFDVNIEFDPDEEWEEVPEEEAEGDGICCKCYEQGTQCSSETGSGAFISTGAAQLVAYWYTR